MDWNQDALEKGLQQEVMRALTHRDRVPVVKMVGSGGSLSVLNQDQTTHQVCGFPKMGMVLIPILTGMP